VAYSILYSLAKFNTGIKSNKLAPATILLIRGCPGQALAMTLPWYSLAQSKCTGIVSQIRP
jgi:hypothetical protein